MADSQQPSVLAGIQGALHLYDMTRQVMHNQDPRARDLADNLDDVSLADVIEMADQQVDRVGVPLPHVEDHELENGLLVAVDTAKTPVAPENITHMKMGIKDGKQVTRLYDAKSEWFQEIHHPPDADLDVDIVHNDQVVEATFAYGDEEADTIEAEVDEDAAPDKAAADTDESAEELPDDGVEVPTLEEFLENNEWARQKLEQKADDIPLIDDVDELIKTFGDTRMDELGEQFTGGASGLGGLPPVGDVDDEDE